MKVAVVHGLADGVAGGDTPEAVQVVCQALESRGHPVARVATEDGVEGVLGQLRAFGPDLVFNLAERGRSRDTVYPALFAEMRLPYTGPEPYSLTITTDKHLTKTVARENGVPVPQGFVVGVATLPTVQWSGVRLPVMVKPNFEEDGRGIGLWSICRTMADLQERVRALLAEYEGVLVEEYLPGLDLAVPWLEGVGDGVLPACEVVYGNAPIKVRDNGEAPALRCPAPLADPVLAQVRACVRRLVRALGLRDVAQFDFRLTPDGVPFLLEVNALPSLRPASAVLIAAEAKGMSAADVVLRVCDGALKRRRGTNGAGLAARDKAKALRVGFVYNLKRVAPTKDGDHEAEYDPPKTIHAIQSALERLGNVVVPLEATETLPQRLSDARVDVVFNIAEGWRGRTREAQVPALCDLLGVPHTGSDATTLSIAMDKAISKDLFLRNGILTPVSQLFRSHRDKLEKHLRFPLIVKPNAEGSSKGIYTNAVCMNEDELRVQVREAVARYNQPVLVEQYISGREFTVALFQTDTGFRVMPPLEVVFLDPSNRYPVYSFEIKQDWDKNVRYDCPAHIDKGMERALANAAKKAFRAIGCRDYARVDIRFDQAGKVPYVLEVNPLPGLTPNFSDMCLIANGCGIGYDELIAMILRYAVRRTRLRPGRAKAPAMRPAAVPAQPHEDQGELQLVTIA